MKLARFRIGGDPRLGLVEGNEVVDLTDGGIAYATMLALIADAQAAPDRIKNAARDGARHPLAGVALLAPLERPGKYLAIGMNYAKHLEEADKLGVKRTGHQTWFNKQVTCISGPFDAIEPGVTEKLDYEVELAAVVGRRTKHVSAAEARTAIFGYTVANDVSARDWQFHTPTFTMGKSFDTHGPIGPWIVTADELTDPHRLRLRSWVNGELRQDSDTGQMIHDLWAQIAYLSTAFTLEPGDLIATGTPEGVGVAMDPQRFLRPGDVVRCEVEGIGAIENKVAEAA